jgi:ornithine carbamoyltransferase
VPQGLVSLLTRFGSRVVLAHPDGYGLLDEPLAAARRHASESGGSLEITSSMDEAFAGADAVYPKSWGPLALMQERVEANRAGDAGRMGEIEKQALEQNARHRDWICDERRMGLTARGEALYMHCLPADVGAEVSGSVMERYRDEVSRQANKKVYVIMAVLAAAKVKDLSRRLASLEA